MPRSRSCSRGSIRRKSYVRRSRSGRRSRVKSACVLDRGLPGKGPKTLPIPQRGVLSQFGYHGVKDIPDQKRHAALKRAVDAYGYRKTIGHLVLIANFTRNSDPAAYAIFKNDQQFLSNLYKNYKSRHGVQKTSKKRSLSRMGSKSRRGRRSRKLSCSGSKSRRSRRTRSRRH